MRTKYTICLTKEEKKYVQAILNSNHTTPTFKKRVNILLRARNSAEKNIDWQFTTNSARDKLKRLYHCI